MVKVVMVMIIASAIYIFNFTLFLFLKCILIFNYSLNGLLLSFLFCKALKVAFCVGQMLNK